jgi:hypothetical protein
VSATVTGFSPEVRDGILDRDQNLCAMAGTPGCRGGQATEANHRLNRGMGGTDDVVISSDPANGCAVEHDCNWRLEHSDQFAEEGRRRGVKVILGSRPEDVPYWSGTFRQWTVLRPAGDGRASGMFLTGDTDSARDARDGVVCGSVESGFSIEWKEAA